MFWLFCKNFYYSFLYKESRNVFSIRYLWNTLYIIKKSIIITHRDRNLFSWCSVFSYNLVCARLSLALCLCALLERTEEDRNTFLYCHIQRYILLLQHPAIHMGRHFYSFLYKWRKSLSTHTANNSRYAEINWLEQPNNRLLCKSYYAIVSKINQPPQKK